MNIISIKDFEGNREDIFSLLSQLSYAPIINKQKFNSIISNLGENHNIYVYQLDGKVVGIITILYEQKLIYNGSKIVHIEDLVVDKNYQNRGIASSLINFCLENINKEDNYKIILNCSEELERFYNNFGLIKKNIQMVKYF